MLRLVLSLLLSLLLPAVPAWATPAGDQPAGQVKALLPNATRNAHPVAVNDGLQWNDLLKTDAKGRMRVGLTDGSILSVGSNSELKVVQHDARSQQTSLEVKYGDLRNQVVKITQPGGKYEVKTANAVIGVIGTDFYVGYANHRTTVICYAGRVAVTPTTGRNQTNTVVALLPGQLVVIDTNIPPGGYQPVAAPAEAVQASLSNTDVPIAASPSLNESSTGLGNAPAGAQPTSPQPTGGSTPAQSPGLNQPVPGPEGPPSSSPTTPPSRPSGGGPPAQSPGLNDPGTGPGGPSSSSLTTPTGPSGGGPPAQSPGLNQPVPGPGSPPYSGPTTPSGPTGGNPPVKSPNPNDPAPGPKSPPYSGPTTPPGPSGGPPLKSPAPNDPAPGPGSSPYNGPTAPPGPTGGNPPVKSPGPNDPAPEPGSSPYSGPTTPPGPSGGPPVKSPNPNDPAPGPKSSPYNGPTTPPGPTGGNPPVKSPGPYDPVPGPKSPPYSGPTTPPGPTGGNPPVKSPAPYDPVPGPKSPPYSGPTTPPGPTGGNPPVKSPAPNDPAPGPGSSPYNGPTTPPAPTGGGPPAKSPSLNDPGTGPEGPPSSSPTTPPAPGAPDGCDPGSETLVGLINQERVKQGIPPLQVDPRLTQAAWKHTDTMVRHKTLSHQLDGEPPMDARLSAENVPPAQEAENIGYAPTVAANHESLMRSPLHRDNIMNPVYNVVGVCAVRSGGQLWVTENFAHIAPQYTESQADAAMQEAINQYAQSQGMPPPTRKPQAQLRDMACEMVKNGAVNSQAPAQLPGVDGILVWRTSSPATLPTHAREWLAKPLPSGYSLGSCFAPNAGRPGGIYWVVMVTY